MVVKLTVHVRNVIFFLQAQNSEILIFGTFLAKFSILAYVLLKIPCFEVRPCLWQHCDDVGCLYLFWYVWKEETHSYTMVPIRPILGVQFPNAQGGGNHPLVTCVTKKGLVR